MIGSTRTARPENELTWFAVAAGVATLGAVVTLGSHNPLVLLVAPFGGIGLIFAARRPALALVIIVVVEITNLATVLQPHIGIPIFKVSLALGLLASGLALRAPEARKRLNAWTWISVGFLAIYLATQAVAVIGSIDVAASVAGMRPILLDCMFLMVVILLVQMTARPWLVAAAVVIPFAVLSVLSLINQLVYGGSMSFGGFSTVTTSSGELVTTLRYGGPLPDSNFWGRDLVMGLPLAAALLTHARRRRERMRAIGWALAVLAHLVGIYLTQSRGTFLAAAVAIAVWFVASEARVRRWGLAALPLGLLAYLAPGVGDRLKATLLDLTHTHRNSHIDPSLLGRIAAQQEASTMFHERPYFGFGPATFPGQVVNFAGRVAVAVREPAAAPHNLYLEFLAQSGLIGLFGWTVMVVGFVTVTILRLIAQPRSRERVLAAGVCAAIFAWSMASLGLHLAYFRSFAVVLALAIGLAPAWPVSGAVVRVLLRNVGVWSAAGVLGACASWLYLSVKSTPAFVATQHMTVVPVGPPDGWYAYALDIRSRVELLPTFALIMGDERSPVAVEADSVRGLLTFTTTADTADNARDEIQLAVAHAGTMLHSSIGYHQYSLETIGRMRMSPVGTRPEHASYYAGLIGAVTVLVGGFALSRVTGRRPPEAPAGRLPTRELVSA
jgi:hypothetical protein